MHRRPGAAPLSPASDKIPVDGTTGALLLRMDDRERSEIPAGRAVAPGLRELFGL